jgi:hypothetical protein
VATIDDAYMAVADLPDVRTDHVEAAAEMALEVVAGVIGHRKFASRTIRRQRRDRSRHRLRTRR